MFNFFLNDNFQEDLLNDIENSKENRNSSQSTITIRNTEEYEDEDIFSDIFIYDDPLSEEDIYTNDHKDQTQYINDDDDNNNKKIYKKKENLFYIGVYNDEDQLVGYKKIENQFDSLFNYFLTYQNNTLTYVPKRREDYILKELLKFLNKNEREIYFLFKEYFNIGDENDSELKDEDLHDDFLWFIEFSIDNNGDIKESEDYHSNKKRGSSNEKNEFNNEGGYEYPTYILVKYYFGIYNSNKNRIYYLYEFGHYLHFHQIINVYYQLLNMKRKTFLENYFVKIITEWKSSLLDKY